MLSRSEFTSKYCKKAETLWDYSNRAVVIDRSEGIPKFIFFEKKLVEGNIFYKLIMETHDFRAGVEIARKHWDVKPEEVQVELKESDFVEHIESMLLSVVKSHKKQKMVSERQTQRKEDSHLRDLEKSLNENRQSLKKAKKDKDDLLIDLMEAAISTAEKEMQQYVDLMKYGAVEDSEIVLELEDFLACLNEDGKNRLQKFDFSIVSFRDGQWHAWYPKLEVLVNHHRSKEKQISSYLEFLESPQLAQVRSEWDSDPMVKVPTSDR